MLVWAYMAFKTVRIWLDDSFYCRKGVTEKRNCAERGKEKKKVWFLPCSFSLVFCCTCGILFSPKGDVFKTRDCLFAGGKKHWMKQSYFHETSAGCVYFYMIKFKHVNQWFNTCLSSIRQTPVKIMNEWLLPWRMLINAAPAKSVNIVRTPKTSNMPKSSSVDLHGC